MKDRKIERMKEFPSKQKSTTADFRAKHFLLFQYPRFFFGGGEKINKWVPEKLSGKEKGFMREV